MSTAIASARDLLVAPAVSAKRSLRTAKVLFMSLIGLAFMVVAGGSTAIGATGDPTVPDPTGGQSVTLDLGGLTDKPTTSLITIIALTFLALTPAILLTCTSFTKVVMVLSLTRNALGLQTSPPNQVITGLALFISLFIMAPVVSQVNHDGVQPYLKGTLTASQAWDSGIKPLRTFMIDNTNDDDMQLLTSVAHRDLPKSRDDIPLSTLIPSFVLSEIKEAFIIGFMIFIPFLVIDLIVSGTLMSLGMMMMPPVMISLPFKLLLFVLVDGWALIIRALVGSYH